MRRKQMFTQLSTGSKHGETGKLWGKNGETVYIITEIVDINRKKAEKIDFFGQICYSIHEKISAFMSGFDGFYTCFVLR